MYDNKKQQHCLKPLANNNNDNKLLSTTTNHDIHIFPDDETTLVKYKYSIIVLFPFIFPFVL